MRVAPILKKVLRPARDAAVALATYPWGVRRTVNGQQVRVDWRSRYSFPPVYDAGVTALIRARLRSGARCWNIGANVGVHALQLAYAVGTTGSVLAVEPNPAAAELLRRNLALNGLAERVTVSRIAIGEHSGTTSFFIAGADPMGRPGRANPLLPRAVEIQVPVRTLDELLHENGRPDCVVIDIEGWEIGALLGAQSLLRLKPLPLLIVELHPDAWEWSGHSRSQLADLLQTNALVIEPLAGQLNSFLELGQVLVRRAQTPDRSSQGSESE